MAKNNNIQASNNTNNNKEEKKMTAKERWMANLQKGEELGYKAARKTGYGIGYANETIKDEAAYAAQKVKSAISSTKVAQEFSNGLYNGKNNAYYDFVQRCVSREQKAREKADNKAMKQAVNEMLTDADICL